MNRPRRCGVWPPKIDDPISGGTLDPIKRLHNTLDSLNKGIAEGATRAAAPHYLRFATDGTGQAVRWRVVAAAALGRLAGLASRAVGIFGRLMESDQPSVARRAAKAVLELGPRLRETEFEERMSRLEDEADEEPHGNLSAVIIDNDEWYGDRGSSGSSRSSA